MRWEVPRIWEGDTCYILAGGPSLIGFDFGLLSDRRVITINDLWKFCDGLHYFCDPPWFHYQWSRNFPSKAGVRFRDHFFRNFWVKGGEPIKSHPNLREVPFSSQFGFDPNPKFLRHGSNSGYAAIHLAAHLGVKRIVLLGYDMRVVNGRSHCHDGPRVAASEFAKNLRDSMLPLFDYLVKPLADREIEVVNATPGSHLTCWPSADLISILKGEAEWKRLQAEIPVGQ